MAADLCPSMVWTDLGLAPVLMAREAAVCRKSCGVITGNVGSDSIHRATAGANVLLRNLDTLSCRPVWLVNTRASLLSPIIARLEVLGGEAVKFESNRACGVGFHAASPV